MNDSSKLEGCVFLLQMIFRSCFLGPSFQKRGGSKDELAPNTTLTFGLIIPAFSKAISTNVSPSILVCSRLIVVMTLKRGVITFVASNRPPKSSFYNADVAFLFSEMIQSHSKSDFKKRRTKIQFRFWQSYPINDLTLSS